jgi:hypothetical protein
MKVLTQPRSVRRSTNCGGPDQTFTVQFFEIEPSDVGQLLDDYQGHRQRAHLITADEVGREVEVLTQGPGYRCAWINLNRVTK